MSFAKMMKGLIELAEGLDEMDKETRKKSKEPLFFGFNTEDEDDSEAIKTKYKVKRLKKLKEMEEELLDQTVLFIAEKRKLRKIQGEIKRIELSLGI